MNVETAVWSPAHGWDVGPAWPGPTCSAPGAVSLGVVLSDLPGEVVRRALDDLGSAWRPTTVIGSSTAGQSVDGVQRDSTVVVGRIQLDRCELVTATVDVERAGGARRGGRKLAEAIAGSGARAALLLTDRRAGGRTVNGTSLAAGIDDVIPGVALAGALAGHREGSASSWVIGDDGRPTEGRATIVGVVGDVEVGLGSGGGWEAFGPERLVTRSHGDVVDELDGEPALELYHRYLGEHAAGLPATARLLPLSVRDLDGNPFVRTVVDVDEAEQRLRFAGDVPQGSVAQLMCAPSGSLVHHAGLAAKQASSGHEAIALLMSGAGRRLALGERIEDELDAIHAALAPGTRSIGMHPSGELISLGGTCELGNETVTVMTLGPRERDGSRR